MYEIRCRKLNGWTSCSPFHERRGKSKRSVFPWNIEKLHINLEIIRKIFPTACLLSWQCSSFLQFSVTRKPFRYIDDRIGF